jgi:murein L,D-transpeptidase YcbB/YkuD
VFDRDTRAVSHGCVRLEHALDLAKALMAGDPTWTAEKIDTTLQTRDTVRARLPQSIAVYLLYWTVFQDNTGQLNFRPDLYDWDMRLLRLLDAGKA